MSETDRNPYGVHERHEGTIPVDDLEALVAAARDQTPWTAEDYAKSAEHQQWFAENRSWREAIERGDPS